MAAGQELHNSKSPHSIRIVMLQNWDSFLQKVFAYSIPNFAVGLYKVPQKCVHDSQVSLLLTDLVLQNWFP